VARGARIGIAVATIAIVAFGIGALWRTRGTNDELAGPSLQVQLRDGRGGVGGQVIVKQTDGNLRKSVSVEAHGTTLAVGPGHYVVVGVSDASVPCRSATAVVGSDPQAVTLSCLRHRANEAR
jgi:hypothetical protein